MRFGGRVIALSIAAALLAGAVGWEATRASKVVDDDEVIRRSAASLASSDATGALWFCPLTASTSGVKGASIRLSRDPSRNPKPVESSVTISLRGPAGQMREAQRSVPTSGLLVPVIDLLGSDVSIETLPSIAAIIESSDPAILVEASLGAKSNGFVPCSATVSDKWIVADGSTVLGATMELALFNPFPGNALIDLRFWSERGVARPTALQGLVVPGGSLRIVNVGDFVRRRERVAVEIASRAGRIVPAMNQTLRGRANLVLAAPEASSVWFMPGANGSDTQPEQFTLVNPGSEDASVELTATLDPSDVEPFELVVPADSSVVISPTSEGRVPGKTPYAVVAKVASGPDIVVVRTVAGTVKSKAPVFGLVASPLTATRWVVPMAPSGGVVTIFNPYDVATNVVVQSDGKDLMPGFTVAAGALKTVTVGKATDPARAILIQADDAPVVVTSSQTGSEATATQVGFGARPER
jgi:hypothetical protein